MLKKQLLREQLPERIRDHIIDGTIAAGESINEQSLADHYDLSRTPVREALLGLEREGFVEATANRGFSVNSLCHQDARDLAAIRSVLEPLALRQSGIPDAARMDELEALNEKMKAESITRDAMIELDETFHTTLIARCPNERLLHILAGLRLQSRRYEFAIFRSVGNGPSTAQHDQILSRLKAHRLDGACTMLGNNMLGSPSAAKTGARRR